MKTALIAALGAGVLSFHAPAQAEMQGFDGTWNVRLVTSCRSLRSARALPRRCRGRRDRSAAALSKMFGAEGVNFAVESPPPQAQPQTS
jgi:hypothetical protein